MATVERRSHIRYELIRNIEYVLVSAPDEEVLKGIIIDISDAGVGMYVFKPVSSGQKVMIKSGLDDARQEMTVRWCKELGEDVYRAGLLFDSRS